MGMLETTTTNGENKMKTLDTYTALVDENNTQLSTMPETADTPELTDADLDRMFNENTPDRTPSPKYQAACDLLESLKAEMPYFQQLAEDEYIPLKEEAEERGLTTEINTSTSLVNIADTMENIMELLARHPYGFKYGSRDSKGNIVLEPYTDAENAEAEQAMKEVLLRKKQTV